MSTQPDAMGALLAALFGFVAVLLFFGFRGREERRFLLPLAIASFTLRILLVPLYYEALVDEGFEGFAYLDSYQYHLDGIEVAHELDTGITGNSRTWAMVDPGYSIFTGIVYWIAGPNTLVVRMLNCMFGVFVLLYVYRTSRLFFDDVRCARYASILAAFLPYTIIITINHVKEGVVILLSVFIFYHAMKVIRFESRWGTSLALLVVGLGAMTFFRSGFVLPFMGILFLCFVFSSQSLPRAVALAVPTILALLVLQYVVGDTLPVGVGRSVERLQGKLHGSADLTSVGGLARLVRMTSIWEIYKLPVATVLALILPFPPFLKGDMPSVLLSWANLANLAILPNMIRGGIDSMRHGQWRRRAPLILFPGIFMVLLGATHVGVQRYRETVIPVILVIVAAGRRRAGPRSYLLEAVVYGTLVLLGAVVYFSRMS